MTPTAEHMTPSAIIDEAIAASRDIETLLMEENAALEADDRSQLEQMVKRKGRMVGKLETLLKMVKQQQEAIKADSSNKARLKDLQAAMDRYQAAAHRNVILLQSAHQVTSDFLVLVVQQLAKAKAPAHAYGRSGKMQDHTGGSGLVNKSI